MRKQRKLLPLGKTAAQVHSGILDCEPFWKRESFNYLILPVNYFVNFDIEKWYAAAAAAHHHHHLQQQQQQPMMMCGLTVLISPPANCEKALSQQSSGSQV